MAFLVRCFWVLVLAIWLPSSMHCSLEAAGMALVDCCAHPHSSGEDPHPDDADPCTPCPTCSLVESGAFFIPSLPHGVKPVWSVVWWLTPNAPPPPPARFIAGFPAAAIPPKVPPSWQFLERAAPLPRPPSLPS